MYRLKGFTMIELMVAMAILAALFSIGLPSYQAWVQNTRVRAAAESVLHGLQLAKAEAVRRNSAVGFYLVSDLTSSCAASSTEGNWVISMQDPVAACDVAPSDTVAPQIMQKRSQQEGATDIVTIATTPAGRSRIVFSPLGRGTNTAVDFTQIDFAAASPVPGGRNLRILIGAGGNLRMCDPQLTGNDPRRC